MLRCANRLRRPVASTAFRHASQVATTTSGTLCGAASAGRSLWSRGQIQPRAPIVSNGSKQVARNTDISSPSLQQVSVRSSHSHAPLPHRAFIALGSNMGDSIAMIEQACKQMEATGYVKILRTSSLYETKAMYVLDQDNFVNGACEVIATSS